MLCRKAVSAFLLALLLYTPVFSAGGRLPDGLIIGDDEGIRVTRDGEYFIQARGLRPGDVVRKLITIQNTQQDDSEYQLYLQVQPLETTGPANLLDDTQLRLSMGGKVLYEGRTRGDSGPDMTKEPIALGTYRGGDSRVLEVVITVDADIEIAKVASTAEIAWTFSAINKPGRGDGGGGYRPEGGRGRYQERDGDLPPLDQDSPIGHEIPADRPATIGDAPPMGGNAAVLAALAALFVSFGVLVYYHKHR